MMENQTPVVTGRQESKFSGEFKFKTYNNLPLRICCENIMGITLICNIQIFHSSFNKPVIPNLPVKEGGETKLIIVEQTYLLY